MTSRLIQIAPVVPAGAKLRVISGFDLVEIENCIDIVWAILRWVDGYLAEEDIVAEVANECRVDPVLAASVINDLKDLGVLGDPRLLYDLILRCSENPMPFPPEMRIAEYEDHEAAVGWVPCGQLLRLSDAEKREELSRGSCRNFGDETINEADLAALLQSTCFRPPSAGGLYPIHLAVILNHPVGDFQQGAYHYEPREHGLVSIPNLSREEIFYGLNREDGIYNAPVVIVVSGDMDRQVAKYANRGWRYSLIEAGIATERILAVAFQLGLGSLVFGGYNDHALGRAIFGEQLGQMRTLIAIALGYQSPGTLDGTELESLHDRLDRQFVGDDKIVEDVGLTNLWRASGDLSFHHALATMRDRERDSRTPAEQRACGGSGVSSTSAHVKAIVECIERYSCGELRVDRVGPARLVNPTFDISAFSPLTFGQIASTPFLSHFDPELAIQWAEAVCLRSGEQTYIPVDLVYYPLNHEQLGRPLWALANSSGVASHLDVAEARGRAFLELIERHAVLTSWHMQTPPLLVPEDQLTDYLRNRRRYWQNEGYELLVLDYSERGVPIAGVAIGSDDRIPAFAFGSAATMSWQESVQKALQEAEVSLAEYRSFGTEMAQNCDILFPIDHGRYHAVDVERTAWQFLRSGLQQCYCCEAEQVADLNHLMRAVDAIEVTIDSPSPIHTVRVLSPELFPISFGRVMEFRPPWSVAPPIPHFIA